LLARAAPARIVAPDFMVCGACLCSSARRHGGGTDRSSAPLLLRRLATGSVRTVGLGGSALDQLPRRCWSRGRRRGGRRRDAEDRRHDRALNAIGQLVEHLEGLVLVLDQGVALAVRTQPDALAELLH